ncbi:Putative rmlC-like cupin domain superfamily, rmlC-like jelly roll protein [Septoria linicola]|uniref:RmlC-like cupin domain superfamily, rmlC-like jelly roll protein n=1 Tax=Septoria linicola TaxID=215465 RepID=A0A9Q9APA6_9PEZI|nr:putative rmlC-like cupin domain superfamily, rmlC-like jelly roll protein [Septoria linicola]USW50648.1 Putative rmlC-like cupin domain superfamily, rmlC-like jelly roll protein [Septoria linicola]
MAPKLGAAVAGLRPCKRYIATHNGDGKSVYAEAPEQVFSGAMARSYSINSVPAVLEDDVDVKAYKAETGVTSYRTPGIVPPQPGANLVVVDLAPGAQSLMHRTVSIDFSICVIGEIDHELDGGEKVRLYPGDHIVQRGTMHRWSNPTDKPARFVACAIPCVPFDIAGQQLKEVHLPNKPKSKL